MQSLQFFATTFMQPIESIQLGFWNTHPLSKDETSECYRQCL